MPNAKEIASAVETILSLERASDGYRKCVRAVKAGPSAEQLSEINGTLKMIELSQDRAKQASQAASDAARFSELFAKHLRAQYGIGRHPKSNHRDQPQAGDDRA